MTTSNQPQPEASAALPAFEVGAKKTEPVAPSAAEIAASGRDWVVFHDSAGRMSIFNVGEILRIVRNDDANVTSIMVPDVRRVCAFFPNEATQANMRQAINE